MRLYREEHTKKAKRNDTHTHSTAQEQSHTKIEKQKATTQQLYACIKLGGERDYELM